MINKERLINEFIRLTKFNSESFNEKEIQSYIINELIKLGISVKEDNSKDNYKKYTNSIGISNNVYGYLKGSQSDGIILASHLDTVSPGNNKHAIIDGNKITSDGTTVLGADDLSAVASLLEVLRVIKENNLKHKDIEVLFFVAEEPFAKGSKHFDYSLLKNKEAYVFDLEGNINNAAVSAPSIISFTVKIKGKAAHAGFNPEAGINSLLIFNKALNEIKLGRVNDITTINIGLIQGGSGVNIVPEELILKGEIRSLDNDIALNELQKIKQIFQDSAISLGGDIIFDYDVAFNAYKVDLGNRVIERYIRAVKEINDKDIHLIDTFGGSDNNNLSAHGITGIVVGNGMRNVHSKEEYILIDDLYDTARLILNLVKEG